MKITTAIILLVFTTFLFANTAPEVSNLIAEQRDDGSMLVDIYYDVYDADSDAMNIIMQVSDDDGITWAIVCNLISGDVGASIYSGNGKHILWNVVSEHPNINTDFLFKIIADDGFTDGCGTVIDIDDNVYQTVQIGDQCWMAENLKVTHYRDGTPIPLITESNDWNNTSAGAYCVYGDADTYGNLYNWYAVNNGRNIAPEGWHIPTDEEIIELEMALGMSEIEANDNQWRGIDEGSQLAGEADLWTNGDLENNSVFDTSGFNFLPSGYRTDNGYYGNLGTRGYFWSSSYESYSAWMRYISYANSMIYRGHAHRRIGYSVRCVRD